MYISLALGLIATAKQRQRLVEYGLYFLVATSDLLVTAYRGFYFPAVQTSLPTKNKILLRFG